jgi:hypothetical protein
VVAYGRENEKTGLTIGDDANTFSFDNSSSPLALGALAFVADGTGSDSEFQTLGVVTASSAGGITTTLFTNSDKGTAAKLWSPTAGFQFPENFASPAIRDRHLGVVHQRPKGGQPWRVQTSNAFETLEWRYPQNDHAGFALFRDFIVNDRSDSLDTFTAAYWDFQAIDTSDPDNSIGSAQCAEVSLAKSILQFRETTVGTIQDSIPLDVISFDAYVES